MIIRLIKAYFNLCRHPYDTAVTFGQVPYLLKKDEEGNWIQQTTGKSRFWATMGWTIPILSAAYYGWSIRKSFAEDDNQSGAWLEGYETGAATRNAMHQGDVDRAYNRGLYDALAEKE